MKLYAINTVARRDNAPGRIMLDIIDAMTSIGGTSRFYTRHGLHTYIHGFLSRITDSEGLHTKSATYRLIDDITSFAPDIIHIHNIHGHYINYEILFSFLRTAGIPIVWTLHDCWAWTGHCVHYTSAKCDKWQSGCHDCPITGSYPKSWFRDNSLINWQLKHKSFSDIPNLTIVCVSEWQAAQARQSFLKNYPIKVIPNGVDTTIFRPYSIAPHPDFRIIAVASNWNLNKGREHLFRLQSHLNSDETLNLISGIHNRAELAQIYSDADLFLNPSEEETFGMTTIEAMACGTPAIVNCHTALPETVTSPTTGLVVDFSDINATIEAIRRIKALGKNNFINPCRNLIINNYSLSTMTDSYLRLFNEIIK